MRTMQFILFRILFFSILTSMAIAASESSQSAKEASRNKQGLQYYQEAFYQQLPAENARNADKLFDRAIAKFKDAIAINPKNVEAHRHLARIYYVRKDFLHAADAYRKVTILEPLDIDAYLQLALSYTQIARFEEAIRALEDAKSAAKDPEAIDKLNGYIQKIRERN
jgi:tetratricopeptide (TPR) repeat protein